MRIPNTHLHIFDAIEVVGRHLFGDEWTGREREVSAKVKERYQLPDVMDVISLSDEEFQLRWHTDEDYRLRRYHTYDGKSHKRIQHTPPEITIDDTRLKELEAAADNNNERLNAAIEEMAQLLYADSDMIQLHDKDGQRERDNFSRDFWLGPHADGVLKTHRDDVNRLNSVGTMSYKFPLIDKAKLMLAMGLNNQESHDDNHSLPVSQLAQAGKSPSDVKRGRGRQKEYVEDEKIVHLARYFMTTRGNATKTWAADEALRWSLDNGWLSAPDLYADSDKSDGGTAFKTALKRISELI